ncbi:MAG TPA: nuclear transport factor 2 family protein [Albidovulum sp.]|uniref:nuclear transport factor 2 family protein n=1 Tax=Albidovulum sp. TaxID=1872424 RepID=UPI002BACCA18|nr:nuclear transport factor 2 family protein [Albidovulum sp.]
MTQDPDRIRRFASDYVDAWNSGRPERVAACFAEEGGIIINRGEPWQGRGRVAEMAAGFYADVAEMTVFCDDLRIAGDHVAFLWTFTGRHTGTGRALDVKGWEEWDLGPGGTIRASLGWYDAADYARQVAGG